jgi:hypothetical protein
VISTPQKTMAAPATASINHPPNLSKRDVQVFRGKAFQQDNFYYQR